MMMTQTSILTVLQARPDWGPAAVFSAVNAVLWENLSRLRTGRYMTLNLVRLDPGGLTLAGKHQDLLVWRAAGRRVDRVSNEGSWLGLAPEVGDAVVDEHVPMAAGDLALFYTDGATEAMDAQGRMFGAERLAATLAEVAALPLPQALDRLFAAVAAFQARQDDDVTMLLVRCAPRAEGP
jgi:sigma-B regulation protein RsbU (phosphoserine phosphatase)